MGITGSHPHIYHQSMSGSRKCRLCRHGVPSKYSLSTHLCYRPCAEERFFPPPILHTKFHELDLNSSVINIFSTADISQVLKQNPPLKSNDNRRKRFPSPELPGTSGCRHKKLPFLVSENSRQKLSSQKDSSKRKIGVTMLPTSSVSSGVDSVSEDSAVDVEKVKKEEEQCDEEVSSKCESKSCELINEHSAETDSHIARYSLDSGASFDEEDTKNAVFDDSSACKNFEAVFEKERRSGGSQVNIQGSHSRKKSSSKHKKSRKFSLVKSFRKMSKRAISLPSAHMASSSKSEFLFFQFHTIHNITEMFISVML